ncbi:1404_t:CDS:10 [Ambispora gerdemannii]|uniref:1404_t:CDS:1 n=1 Tax=Ambispora gerdemannii TaxID=144530 RepID=A0A9N8ZWF4_9GLOM|nr:1404_t:CDS:10 [Ambispora gerdemannii]
MASDKKKSHKKSNNSDIQQSTSSINSSSSNTTDEPPPKRARIFLKIRNNPTNQEAPASTSAKAVESNISSNIITKSAESNVSSNIVTTTRETDDAEIEIGDNDDATSMDVDVVTASLAASQNVIASSPPTPPNTTTFNKQPMKLKIRFSTGALLSSSTAPAAVGMSSSSTTVPPVETPSTKEHKRKRHHHHKKHHKKGGADNDGGGPSEGEISEGEGKSHKKKKVKHGQLATKGIKGEALFVNEESIMEGKDRTTKKESDVRKAEEEKPEIINFEKGKDSSVQEQPVVKQEKGKMKAIDLGRDEEAVAAPEKSFIKNDKDKNNEIDVEEIDEVNAASEQIIKKDKGKGKAVDMGREEQDMTNTKRPTFEKNQQDNISNVPGKTIGKDVKPIENSEHKKEKISNKSRSKKSAPEVPVQPVEEIVQMITRRQASLMSGTAKLTTTTITPAAKKASKNIAPELLDEPSIITRGQAAKSSVSSASGFNGGKNDAPLEVVGFASSSKSKSTELKIKADAGSSSFAVTTPTGKPKNTSTRKIATPKKRAPVIPKRKYEFKAVMLKILEGCEKKDPYGDFIEPVDTAAVPDYLDIIKNPMDFTTIRHKIEDNKYLEIDKFKDDLLLVANNAMTYNPKGTRWYKNAERIYNFVIKAVERDKLNIEKEEAKIKELQAGPANSQKSRIISSSAGVAFGGKGKSAASGSKKTTRKRKRAGKYELDGSLIPRPEILEEIDLNPPYFGEPPELTVIGQFAGANPTRPAGFLDYGPYATLGPGVYHTQDTFNYYMRGLLGDVGIAYTSSIQNFIQNMDDEIKEDANCRLDNISLGAFSIDNAVSNLMQYKNHIQGEVRINTPQGEIDVAQEIENIKQRKVDEELRKAAEQVLSEADFLRGSRNVALAASIVGESLECSLEKNKSLLKEIINLRKGASVAAAGKEEQLVEEARERLIQATQQYNIIPSTSQVQSMAHMTSAQSFTTNRGAALLAPTVFGFGTSGQTSNPPPALPTSATGRELPLLTAAGAHTSTPRTGRQRAQSTGARCANCGTSDTPGWRAACGLYYAKNRSHRPSNLWANKH